MQKPPTNKLEQVKLTQKENIIEWIINALAFLMLLAFFLKIVFL